MIKAEPKKWARIIFDPYLDKLLKKNFSNFYAINDPPSVAEDESIVLTPNHFSWWDGFFIDYVVKKFFKRNFFIMMLEEQLKRFWFFKYLGAYGFDQNNSKSVSETARYTKEILSDPRNLAVIYPQGKIEPYDAENYNLKQGLRVFTGGSSKIKIIPVAFKIQFREEKKPCVAALFGESIGSESLKNHFDQYARNFFDVRKKMNDELKLEKKFRDLFVK